MQRNIYLTLLHLEQTEPGKEKPTNVPDSVIKAALLRRATVDINRILSIRSAKQALSSLLARGSVGDELWQRFQRAELEMEEELKDVVNEVRCSAFLVQRGLLTWFARLTHLHLDGVVRSSSPLTKWPAMHCYGNVSRKYKPKPKRIVNGGIGNEKLPRLNF
jgi:hypothetical protein